MRKSIKKIGVYLLTTAMLLLPISAMPANPLTATVEAHSGRTDSKGGHKDNKNKSGLGSYHYHCGGNEPHLHNSGVCPYSSESKTQSNSSHESKKHSTSSSTVKKVQAALNKKGYKCGKADGVMGKKTIVAIKEFQKDEGLTVDGKIGPEVKNALGI